MMESIKRPNCMESEKDMEVLENKGVGKLFGPGTPVQETIDYITNWVKSNRR